MKNKVYMIESGTTKKWYKVESNNCDNAIKIMSNYENRIWGNCSSQLYDGTNDNQAIDYIKL